MRGMGGREREREKERATSEASTPSGRGKNEGEERVMLTRQTIGRIQVTNCQPTMAAFEGRKRRSRKRKGPKRRPASGRAPGEESGRGFFFKTSLFPVCLSYLPPCTYDVRYGCMRCYVSLPLGTAATHIPSLHTHTHTHTLTHPGPPAIWLAIWNIGVTCSERETKGRTMYNARSVLGMCGNTSSDLRLGFALLVLAAYP